MNEISPHWRADRIIEELSRSMVPGKDFLSPHISVRLYEQICEQIAYAVERALSDADDEKQSLTARADDTP